MNPSLVLYGTDVPAKSLIFFTFDPEPRFLNEEEFKVRFFQFEAAIENHSLWRSMVARGSLSGEVFQQFIHRLLNIGGLDCLWATASGLKFTLKDVSYVDIIDQIRNLITELYGACDFRQTPFDSLARSLSDSVDGATIYYEDVT